MLLALTSQGVSCVQAAVALLWSRTRHVLARQGDRPELFSDQPGHTGFPTALVCAGVEPGRQRAPRLPGCQELQQGTSPFATSSPSFQHTLLLRAVTSCVNGILQLCASTCMSLRLLTLLLCDLRRAPCSSCQQVTHACHSNKPTPFSKGVDVICHAVLQAMDLIAIAQQTGDVSPEAYQRLALRGNLTPPQMAGVEELLQRLAAAEAAANPFANGGGSGGGAPEASPSGGGGGGYAQFRPPAVIPPSMASPARSQVCRHLFQHQEKYISSVLISDT